MNASDALAQLANLAEDIDGDSPDLIGLGQLAANAAAAAEHWPRVDALAFRDALDKVIADIEKRRGAIEDELGGVARRGRAVRGYGRPMGVSGATTAQRVYRKG